MFFEEEGGEESFVAGTVYRNATAKELCKVGCFFGFKAKPSSIQNIFFDRNRISIS